MKNDSNKNDDNCNYVNDDNSNHNIKVIVIISSCYRTVPSAIWEIFSEFLIF